MDMQTKLTKAAFRAIVKQYKAVNRLVNTNSPNAYFDAVEALNKLLVQFLRMDFSVLNGKDLLLLCSMVSSHRPVKPFSFLVSCSIYCKQTGIK